MNNLYPLKFKPVFKEKIWGGEKIRTKLGLNFSPLPNCGEAWILSGVPGSETKVSNGFLKGNTLTELMEVFMDDLVGEEIFLNNEKEFPILIKFIDSRDWLSVQVHPDDAVAKRQKIGHGKSEMWYIMDAEKNAELITGFNGIVGKETYLEALHEKKLRDILNAVKVRKGDVFYIPAGRIHALGPGILLAEIQQTSDTTYRIYDWDRIDKKGRSRELHTELALDAVDFSPVSNYRTNYRKLKNHTENLIDTSHFSVNILEFDQPVKKDYTLLDSFVLYVCVEGAAMIHSYGKKESLKTGETILIPAVMDHIVLEPDGVSKILEVFINK